MISVGKSWEFGDDKIALHQRVVEMSSGQTPGVISFSKHGPGCVAFKRRAEFVLGLTVSWRMPGEPSVERQCCSVFPAKKLDDMSCWP